MLSGTAATFSDFTVDDVEGPDTITRWRAHWMPQPRRHGDRARRSGDTLRLFAIARFEVSLPDECLFACMAGVPRTAVPGPVGLETSQTRRYVAGDA